MCPHWKWYAAVDNERAHDIKRVGAQKNHNKCILKTCTNKNEYICSCIRRAHKDTKKKYKQWHDLYTYSK